MDANVFANTPVSAIYIGLNAILMIVLAYIVIKNRQRTEVGIGDGGDEGLQAAIRAHANFVEYVPMALLLILVLEIMGAWVVLLHLLGATLTIGRVAHAHGLITGKGGAAMTRFWGTVLTGLVILVGAAMSIYLGVS